MKKISHILFVVAILTVLLTSASVCSAVIQANEEHVEITAQVNTADNAAANALNGFVKEGGNIYYYVNGVKQTGFKKINNKIYYFDTSTKIMATGFKKINNKIYYFEPSSGIMATGFRMINNHIYYFTPSSGIMFTGAHTINSKSYTFNSSGILVSTTPGFLKIGSKIYYVNSNGTLKTGFYKHTNGRIYYFDPSTRVMTTGFKKINGNMYYFNPTSGIMATGFQVVKSKVYYFAPSSGIMFTGVHTINSKRYAFNSSGILVSVTPGFLKIGSDVYYVNSNGTLKTSFYKHTNGNIYYFDPSTCVMATGFKKVLDLIFYFEPNSGKMVTGWRTVNSKQYYFIPSSGIMATGWRNINGTNYYFHNPNGIYEGTTIRVNGLVYSYLTDTTLQVTGYTGTAASVSILSQYEGLKVTQIASGAFKNKTTLKTVSLSKNLTYISSSAFTGCTNLDTMTATSGTYSYTWARQNGYIHKAFALVIGERYFKQDNYDNSRNVGDANNMETMLKSVKSKYGSPFSVVKKINAGYSDIRNAIQTTFADSQEGDVSVFFIATHGYSDDDGELAMPENASDYYYYPYLSFYTLASWLSTYVKGEVIVIIQSCGAGSAVYSPSEQNSYHYFDGEKFLEAAIKAFEEAELKLQESDDLISKSTGDLRKSKFYVLAASRHHEVSWGREYHDEETSYNWFTKYVIDGVGVKGNAPADTNKDSKLSLTELFNYVKKYDTQEHYTYNEDGEIVGPYFQHVQRYPVGSTNVLFWHK